MPTKSFAVEHLAAHLDAIPRIAQWCYSEWGHLTPGNSLDQTIARFRRRIHPGTIPETFVALDGDQIVGTASLVANDLSLRPDLTPWMASVYVDAQYRGLGVGSELVQAMIAEAAALDVEQLYLITHDQMSLYRRLGWQEIERIAYRGEDVTIMVIHPLRE